MKTFTSAFLAAMTVRDLRALASDSQIQRRSVATRKAELINLILDHQELEKDIEEEISPVMSGDDESEQNRANGSDPVRTARPCAEKRIQVGQGRFYPPRPITNLPDRFPVGRGTFPQAFLQGFVTTTAKQPRPPH